MKSIIILLCLFVSVNSYAAVAHVQSTGVVSGGSVASVNHTINGVAAGNTLAVGGICDQGFCPTGAGTGGFTDDKADTFVWMATSTVINRCVVAYSNNVTGGNTQITFTPTSNDFIGFGVAEFSGVKNSSPGDGASSDSDTGTSVTIDGMTTAGTGVVIGCLDYQGATTVTPTNGGITIFEEESWTVISGSVTYELTGVGANNPTWTLGASVNWYGAAFGLLEEPGAGFRPPQLPMVLE